MFNLMLKTEPLLQEQKQRENEYAEKSDYYMLKAAWAYKDLLSGVFGKYDPGAIIGGYLREIFPVIKYPLYFQTDEKIDKSSQKWLLLVDISSWLVTSCNSPYLRIYNYILRVGKWEGTTQEFIDQITSGTHSLFKTSLISWDFNQDNKPAITEDNNEPAQLLKLPLSSGETDEENPHLTPYLLEVLLLGDNTLNLIAEDIDLETWENFVSHVKEYRQKHPDAVSPISIFSASILFWCSLDHYEPPGFLINLAQCWYPEYGFIGTYWVNVLRIDQENEKITQIVEEVENPLEQEWREEHGIGLFDEAFEEGLFELGNAFLSFYILIFPRFHGHIVKHSFSIHTASGSDYQ